MLTEWEAEGRVKGDLARLRKELLSPDKATRIGAEAEVQEFAAEIKAGRNPKVRGAAQGPDQPTYEVKARTEPFTSEKNAQNFFNDRIKAANDQFKGANSRGKVVINLGVETNVGMLEIDQKHARVIVKIALSKGGRGTNITEVVVKDRSGRIIYQGLGD